MARFAIAVLLRCATGALVSAPGVARAQASPDPQSCASTYEQAQRNQRAGKLMKARDGFTHCAQDACPSVVRQQCALALPDLEQSLPTVVFDATDASGDQIIDVRVEVDGTLAASELDGRALSLDPGRHVVRFHRRGGQAVEQTIVLLEGQRRRTVRARFGAEAEVDDEAGGASGARPYGVWPWVFGGVGLAIAGTGLVVFAIGQSDIGEAEDLCPGRVCADQEAVDLGNGGKTKSVAGKVLLGAGAVLIGGALVWQVGFNRPGETNIGVAVQPRGVGLRLSSSF